MTIDILFANGQNTSFPNLDSFYFNQKTDTYILEDSSGIAFVPKNSVLMLMKRKEDDKTE